MLKVICKTIVLTTMIFVTALNAHAALDQTRIKRFQDYLTGIKTLKATLVQQNSDGSQSQGVFYLSREFKNTSYGKLRIEYAPPLKDLIVVDGEYLIHTDGRSLEKNSYGVDQTPAAFLLTPKINFSKELKVKSLESQGTRTILKVVRRGDDSSGILTLKFDTEPMLKLTGWEIVDPQGNLTKVELQDVVIGIELQPGLFKDKR